MTEAAAERVAPPMSELRVAVVGAGWMGVAHLRAYAAMPGVRIVGLVTHSAERAAELSEVFPIEATFDDVGAMLDAARPEGVSITTGEHDHVAPACLALDRGLGVLIEKPMASSVEDATAIAEAAERSGAILVPAHVLRFTAPYQALKREVEAGHLGTIVGVASRRDRTRTVAERYTHIHPAMLTLVHDIDLVLWITGSHVRRVRALQSKRPAQPQPDLVWSQLELENGVVATVSTAALHPAAGNLATADRIDVYGTAGVASVDLTDSLLAVHVQPPAPPDWLFEPPDGSGAFGTEIAHFCDRLRRGLPSEVVSAADAVAGLQVADAIIRSAADDGAVIEI